MQSEGFGSAGFTNPLERTLKEMAGWTGLEPATFCASPLGNPLKAPA